MDVLVPTDAKFYVTTNGAVLPMQRVHTADFWERYRPTFGHVHFTGRQVATPPDNDVSPATGDGIKFHCLPSRYGLRGSLQTASRLISLLSAYPTAAVCLRMPSLSSAIVGLECLRRRRPFGVEVVGDPATGLVAPAGIMTPMGIARKFLIWAQRKLCAEAIGTAYVTERALQRHYPPGELEFTTNYSTINLTEENFRERGDVTIAGPRLVHVGNMGNVLYKGQDLLVRIVAGLLDEFPDIQLVLVGGGASKQRVEELAAKLGVYRAVRFLGHLTKEEAIQKVLDESDIFVCPSRQEGLPKALIEAMARGLPAVGTSAGGIPELLSPEMVCGVDSVDEIKACLCRLVESPELRRSESQRNYEKAKDYRIENLRPRRDVYYKAVREATERYLVDKKPS